MKKWLLLLVLLTSLYGCQNHTLDTSKLEIVEPKNGKEISKDMLKNLPIDYKASSTKEAIEALPFSVKLPSKLPFEAKPFQVQMLQEIKHDGKTVTIDFLALPKDENDARFLTIFVTNQKNVTFSSPEKELKLANNINGYMTNSSIHFRMKDILYRIEYTYQEDDDAITENELLDIANEMIK